MIFRSAWTRLLEWWPFVRKATMYSAIHKECGDLIVRQSRNLDQQHREWEKQYADKERVLNLRHASELEKTKEVVTKIVDKLCNIEFTNGFRPEIYRISLEFDARMTQYGGMFRDELEIIAEHVARQVRHEIQSAKFIQKAHESERRWFDRKNGVV